MDEQKALNSLLGAIDPARAALAKLDTQVEQLGKHLDEGRISQDQYNSALAKIDKDYGKLEKTTTGFDKLRLGTRQAQENVVQLGNALSSGDWGKASFSDFAKSILADMARIATRQASSALLGSLVGAAASYFGGSAAGGGNGMAAGSAGATSSNLGASSAGYSSTYFPQAKGGAWSSGVQMFADGGAFTNSIVSKPTAFGIARPSSVTGSTLRSARYFWPCSRGMRFSSIALVTAWIRRLASKPTDTCQLTGFASSRAWLTNRW